MKTCTLPPGHNNPSIENLHATTGPQNAFEWKPSRYPRGTKTLQLETFTLPSGQPKPSIVKLHDTAPQVEALTLPSGHKHPSIGNLHITSGTQKSLRLEAFTTQYLNWKSSRYPRVTNIPQLETSTLP